MSFAPHIRKLLLALALFLFCRGSATGQQAFRMEGGAPLFKQLAKARHLGRRASQERMQLAVGLKARDPQALSELLARLYDPKDPEYHHFLTPTQFKDRYAPTAEDVKEVTSFLTGRGLRVTKVHENNLVINVEGSTAAVEEAFSLEMHSYLDADGRRVHAPNREPSITRSFSDRVHAVAGLNGFTRFRTHRLKKKALIPRASGLNSYMTPAKIASAYGLTITPTSGAGETLAIFALDGYNASDIAAFASQFSISAPPLQNVLVDGYSGAAGADDLETCLDIQLAMAIAPGLTKIMVYEGPNTETGVLNTYSKIANDNIAKTVSSSWGAPEDTAPSSFRNAENVIFMQMAAQGQSVFVASGDNGAFDDDARPTVREVDDPASQPYVTAVGGTTLSLTGANAYASETSWGTSSNGQGGGGGISTVWSQPAYQNGLSTSVNQGSSSMRMVPDVSLNSNPDTGYPVYADGQWWAVGGTSAAAPLWAAFTALANQARVANSVARLGFANPTIYNLAKSSLYSTTFHDIADSSTNLYYPAVTGYDLSTGWGSFKGGALISALSLGVLPPAAPTGVNTISGAGFVTIYWTASSGASNYTLLRSTSQSGPFAAIATTLTSTSYADNVSSGSYYYYVVANNAAGSSSASEIKQGSASLSPPGAPTALNAVVIP